MEDLTTDKRWGGMVLDPGDSYCSQFHFHFRQYSVSKLIAERYTDRGE